MIQARIHRRGLACSGGTGKDDESLRSLQALKHDLPLERLEAELLGGLSPLAGRQQPDDYLLAGESRHARDSRVGLVVVDQDATAAVLRLAPFGDIHARDDLK